MTDYIFKDTDSYHRLMRMTADTQLAAQCRLPIEHGLASSRTQMVLYSMPTQTTHGHGSIDTNKLHPQ